MRKLGGRRFGVAVVVCFLLGGCSKSLPTVEIGASGGFVEISGSGPKVSLRVPAGAVDGKLSFALRAIPERLPGAAGPAVEATPHGTTFAKPAALRFSPSPSELANGIAFTELRGATLVDGKWMQLPTSFPAPGVIEVLTTHFSTFALIAPCHASGTGTDFPLVDCPIFNPHITTSAPATVNATAGNVTVKLGFLPTLGGTSPVTVNISGLTPNWTYHLLRDAQLHPAPMVADAAGELHFSQDTTAPHLLVLMEQHGSVALSSSTCIPPIGNFDAGTCTLMNDYPDPPVSIVENGLTLDCKDATTGLRHVIGRPAGPLNVSAGIYVFGNLDVTVRDCDIVNSDLGVLAATSRFTAERVAVSVTAGLGPGAVAFDTSGGDNVFADVAADNYQKGFVASGSKDLALRRATLRTTSTPVILETANRVLFEDVTLDGTLLGPGPSNPADPVPTGAIGMSQAQNVTIRGLTTSSQMTAFDAVVAGVFGSTVQVTGATISGARRAVRLDGPGQSQVDSSSLTGNREGLALLGGSAVVFHNNIHGNSQRQVFGLAAAELSDTRADAGTFGHGNFWGRACPGSLFVAGADSNLPSMIDSHPFGLASAWTNGGTPGCGVGLTAPTLTFPTDGAFVSTATPTFTGTATAGATVELLEGPSVKGSAVASVMGDFAFTANAPFAEGLHSVTLRAVLGPSTSPATSAISFTIDTVAPAAPTITFPSGGATLNDTSTLIAGTAEAGAVAHVTEGVVVLGSGTVEGTGVFQVAVPLAPGSHTLTAIAEDLAGNRSPPSAGLTLGNTLPSPSAPMIGVNGLLQLSSVRDYPDPFVPSLGQVNTVQVEGALHSANNGQGSGSVTTGCSNGSAGNCQAPDIRVRREVIQAATGITVATSEVSAQWTLTSSSGNASRIYSATSPYDGLNNTGTFAAPGPYISKLTVWYSDKPLPPAPPGPPPPVPPDCGPAAKPNGGPCTRDKIELLTTFGLLDRYPVPLPIPGRVPSVETECDGKDNNGNGQIDEGIACDVGLCSPGGCVPRGCGTIVCGSIPDGCGGVRLCGGSCP